MINDILDLAKMEAGKMEVRLTEFRIDAVIAAQCDMVRSLAEDKNIDLRVEIESDLPLLYQDQAKVQQILTNLLSNAIKFTPEGGRITVGASGDPRGQIEFWVADTGVGIPESRKGNHLRKIPPGQSGPRPRQPHPRIQRHRPRPLDRQGAVQAARRRGHRRKRARQRLHLPRRHSLDAHRHRRRRRQARRQARRPLPPLFSLPRRDLTGDSVALPPPPADS